MKTKLALFLQIFILLACAQGRQKQQAQQQTNKNREQARKDMIKTQIKSRGITDSNVLASIEEVPRHLFVPEEYRDKAYGDHPLPIDREQTISQPYIVALMTELLEPEKDDKVLEVGTGSGYQAAVLSNIVDQVYSIEIFKKLADQSGERLQELGYNNVTVKWGDGYAGWEEHAPFDGIIITAAPPEIPDALIDQLKTGGKMVVPVGEHYQELMIIEKTEKGIEKKRITGVRFVPMIEGKRE